MTIGFAELLNAKPENVRRLAKCLKMPRTETQRFRALAQDVDTKLRFIDFKARVLR